MDHHVKIRKGTVLRMDQMCAMGSMFRGRRRTVRSIVDTVLRIRLVSFLLLLDPVMLICVICEYYCCFFFLAYFIMIFNLESVN